MQAPTAELQTACFFCHFDFTTPTIRLACLLTLSQVFSFYVVPGTCTVSIMFCKIVEQNNLRNVPGTCNIYNMYNF